MNIIELAKEAVFVAPNAAKQQLEAFAALVREDERKEILLQHLSQSNTEREQLSSHLMDYNQGFVDGVEEGRSMVQREKQQEPVAYRCWEQTGFKNEYRIWLHQKPQGEGNEPLYTIPPTIEAAVLAEREACAKVCESGRFLHDEAPDAKFGKACAAAIRARGVK